MTQRSDICCPDFTIADKTFIENIESSAQSIKTPSLVDIDQKTGVLLCYIFARRVAMACAVVGRNVVKVVCLRAENHAG